MTIKKVSIITPLYNDEEYIEETIESVISQTYSNWEMIIVDDCSKDNGSSIVKKYSNLDKRIILVTLERNQGGAIARNKGIELASGEYIAFLDSDDTWEDRKLEKQVEFMESNSYTFTYTWYDRVDKKGKKIGRVRSKKMVDYRVLLRSNYIGCLTVMYNQKKLGRISMPIIKKRQDYAMWLDILKKSRYAYCLEESLARYRVVKGSVSSNKIDLLKYNWRVFYRVEKLGLIKSFYYLTWNIVIKLLNYRYKTKQYGGRKMIFGNIREAGKLDYLSPKMKEIIGLLVEKDFRSMKEGKHLIEEDRLFISIEDTTTRDISTIKAEAHKNYADIHMLVSGEERFGVAIESSRNTLSVEYNPENDLMFYDEVEDEKFIDMREGDFIVVFPEDIHRPRIAIDKPVKVRKAIVKIHMELLKAQ